MLIICFFLIVAKLPLITCTCIFLRRNILYTGWAQLNGANAVSFVVVKTFYRILIIFGSEITVYLRSLRS